MTTRPGESPNYPLITEVRLKDFKSIREQSVALSPLTCIVGENSAGKSSLLQALLLITQGLHADSTGDTFPLNGDLIRLGTINDVRRAGARATDKIGLGVTVEWPARARGYGRATELRAREAWALAADSALRYWDEGLYRHREYRQLAHEVSWDLRLSGISEEEPGSTHIREMALRVNPEYEGAGELDLYLKHKVRGVDSVQQMARGDVRLGRFDVLTADLGFSGHLRVGTRKRARSLKGAALSGGLPVGLVAEADLSRRLTRIFVRDVYEAYRFQERPRTHDSERRRPRKPIAEDEFLTEVVDLIGQFLSQEPDPATWPFDFRTFIRPSVGQLVETYSLKGLFEESGMANVTRKIQVHLEEMKLPLAMEGREAEAIDAISAQLADFFRSRLSYLGPLRSEPQVIMLTSPTARAGEVGASGEFTAAVLRARGDQVVIRPGHPEFGSQPEPRTLARAVDEWAHWLGLVDHVTVGDLAQYGLTMTVRLDGVDRSLPLPAVGVGVSQVLPVLVRCLVSQPGEVVLLEQPELHLHPALQQRLADFLIGCARSGRQLVVETHSEHLIARMRRRIVEDPTPATRDLLGIVYASRSHESGETEFTTVDTNEYGGLEDWPKGFFDQGSDEEMAILEEGLRKRLSSKR